MPRVLPILLAGCALALGASAVVDRPVEAAAHKADPALRAAIDNPGRKPENRARDAYRHPAETLAFFGIRPTMTVVEIWPGGGWYTEILAPYLADRGKLVVAAPGDRPAAIDTLIASDPARFGKVGRASFPNRVGGTPVAPGTADMVLTFRNVHNWRMGSGTPDKADYSAEAFRDLYAMLKPGGVLGIEDHRLPESADAARERASGYIKVSTVRKLAEDAGFRFAGASEVNANPKDRADYPDGVWTLPPTLARKDEDRARYVAIGESDRMTLRFVKPAR
jgi:predicted methyltransferase